MRDDERRVKGVDGQLFACEEGCNEYALCGVTPK